MNDQSVETEMLRLLKRQQEATREAGIPNASLRIDRIDRLLSLLADNADRIVEAIGEDFGSRAREQSLAADVLTPMQSLKYCRKHLKKWMKSERRSTTFPFGLLGARAYIEYQPLGSVGVMSPWNFPFALVFSPLASVLAAGNRAMIKPSEITPYSSELMKQLVSSVFDETELAVCVGDVETSVAFSQLPFDHLVFTGSANIAKDVMRNAAGNLTPVTLELGGKSPVIVGRNCNLKLAASRVANGKMLNGGQICLSPDYIFLPEEQEEEFLAYFTKYLLQYYPTVAENPDYTSIINSRQYERIDSLLQDARDKGATVQPIYPDNSLGKEAGGLKHLPYVIRDVSDNMRVMREEIFGPLLPVKTYRDITEVIAYIGERDRPLGLYYFGSPRSQEFKRISESIVCGGITVNDVASHAMQEDLPFGGVGPSGMGRYHGKEGFLSFSHPKSIYTQTPVNITSVMNPPYSDRFRKILDRMIGR